MQLLLILVLLCSGACQQCFNYSGNQQGCLTSLSACRWVQETNQCMPAILQNMGCFNQLSQASCLNQISNPDGSHAYCQFSGYCRILAAPVTNCASTLSQAACLSVVGQLCIWSSGCTQVTASQVSTYTNASWAYASVGVCQLMTGQPVVHILGAYSFLYQFWLVAKQTSSSSASSYLTQLQIPGCVVATTELLAQMNCQTTGLNSISCIQISQTGLYCGFIDGSCQTVKSFNNLTCTQALNKNACLAIINFSQPCYWDNGCKLFAVDATTKCITQKYSVSVSVCQNIQTSECFYNQSTYQCYESCRSTYYMSGQLQCATNIACTYNTIVGQCQFVGKSQCGIQGQNKISCLSAYEYCQFVNGQCQTVGDINVVSCGDGLNRLACLNVGNINEICQFADNTCTDVLIDSSTRCSELTNVNARTCTKVISEGCYLNVHSCASATGAQVCETIGFNEVACLSTTNAVAPCSWSPRIGACSAVTVTKQSSCESLTYVNAVACQNVVYRSNNADQLCRYNSSISACETFVMNVSYTCNTSGFNIAACKSVTNPAQACRFGTTGCVNTTSYLGAAVSCSSLQITTSLTCRMVSNGDRCIYSSTSEACTTSVKPAVGCTAAGLNSYGCAFQSNSCFYYLANYECASTTGFMNSSTLITYTTLDLCNAVIMPNQTCSTILNGITCDMFPSKSACTSITTQGQYCYYNSISNLCISQTFTTQKTCASFTSANQNLCQAYQVEVAGWVLATTHFCTYTAGACTVYSHATFADCGSTNVINLHACVALSSAAMYCYFNTTTLTCTQAMNGATDTVLSTLNCNQGNQSVCTAITTAGQFCQWQSDLIQANKCMTATTTGACVSLTKVNANACAAITTNEQCLWNSGTQSCNVNAGGLNIPCSTSGINSTLCVASTQQACYFNSSTMQCLQVTSSNGAQVDCTSTVNRLGCLASLKSACTWSSGACQKVTGITYSTVTCASLTGPYNPIVCANVTTSGQYCAYDSVAYGCVSTPVVVDCQTGYNANNCQESNSCSLIAFVCTTKPAPSSACTLAGTLIDCMAVSTIPCMWSSNSCKKINVSPLATCANYSGANSYNSIVCSQIAATGQACQSQSSPYQCVAVAAIVSNLACTTPGLNVNACALNTNQMCSFNSDTSSLTFGCKQLTQAPAQCQSSLSKLACIAATQGVCSFSISTATCSDAMSTASTATCTNSDDATAYVYTSNYCSYVIGSACKYDSVNFICEEILAPIAATCSADTTINSIACNTMIHSQTPCTFNLTCQNFTGTLTSCSAAVNSRQCTISTQGQACQWNGTSCITTPSTSVGCSSLTLVNQASCSQQSNGIEACQFQDPSPYNAAKCTLPADTAQPCSTLNKQACISNTANGCYFYNSVCYDIAVTANAQSAQCSSGYYYTAIACALIQTSGQLCQWSANNCITVTVSSTATCSQFASPTYSPNVCAAVTTGACFWNNGCTSIGVVSCLTTKGVNPTSCLTATGNCALFNNGCIDVTALTRQQSITFQCSYCLNQTACTLVGFNLACQWSGSACQTVSKSTVANCSTYTNVSAGVCQITNDTACTWNSGNQSCVQTAVTSQACSTTGLNLLACATLTIGSCAFVEGYCQTQTPSNTCAIGYNQSACLATTQQCCFWNGNQCNSSNLSNNATCSITNYSQGCCSQVLNASCLFGSGACSVLSVFTGLCSTAINQYGCQQMLNPCQWTNNSCQNQPSKSLGCLSTLSIGACVSQSTFCMFTTSCQAGSIISCSQLAYSSQSTSQCQLVTDVACNPAAGSPSQGCQLLTGSQQCNTPNINSVGCLQSLSSCQWTSSTSSCGSFNTNNTQCTANVSRGACMQLSCTGCTCQLVQNQCISYTITPTTLCSTINTSYAGVECRSISTGPCQWDSVNYQCTPTITGSTCTDTSLNQIGCLYINADCTWAALTCQIRPTQTLYTCSSILSKFLCLSNQYTSCVWSSTTHLCSNYSGGIVTCAQHTDLITSPGVCWYYSSDYCAYNGTKCVSATSVNNCAAATSPLSCQAVSGSYCYWDSSNPSSGCQSLPNIASATSKSCVALKYTSQTICVQPQTQGQNCAWNSTKNLCLTLNPYTALCSDPVTQPACRAIATDGQNCVYTNSACTYSTVSNSCQDIVNIYGCMKITVSNQYCQWVGAQCVSISQMNSLTSSSVRLVNQNVCSKMYLINYLPDMSNMIAIKYDQTNFNCRSSDASTDTCTIAGLNYFGCLQTHADQCDWKNNYCTTYSDTTVYTTCAEYSTVSPPVCSTISYTGLLCRWSPSTLSCENMSLTNDVCSQSGLNKAGCLAVTTQACTWLNGKCQQQNISVGFTDCLSFTAPINALACASVDLNQQVCKYGTAQYCVLSFDPTIDTCSTPGLNRRACSLVQNGNCVFQNGQCQFAQFKNAQCGILTYANANTCASIPSDPCKFDPVIGGCTPITLSDQCSVLGINMSACQQLGCYWYQDLMYCTCSALRSAINLKDCNNLPESACSYPCIWNQMCKTKTCSDYDVASCPNATYWKYTCYVSSTTNSCQQAAQCGDLKGVSDCSKYSFTQGTCISDQYNPTHCVDNTCPNLSSSTCLSTSTCSYASASKICYQTPCSSLSQSSCTGVLNQQQCYWYNGQCYGLSNCQAYGALYSSNTTLAQTQCTNTTIVGHACVWQLVAGYTLNYQCGSSQCASYGQAVSNCQGFETTSEVCVLLGNYMCAACSEITDACQCMGYAGYCAYNTQSGCTSVQCSSLDSTTCGIDIKYKFLETSERCVLKSNTCYPICAHLTQSQCGLRSDCLWNSDLLACGIGGSSPVYVNSLSNTVTITTCIILLSNGQQCNEYVYDEFGCITSTQYACKWNDASNQCLDASAINIGCLPSINSYQCLSQYSVDDDEIAQCIFNGYCRSLTQGLNQCSTNLSMGACLSVTGVYCYWNGICQQVQTVPTDITHSSVDACKTLTGAIYAHNVGLWQIFTTAAQTNPTQQTSYYLQRIQPGCQLLSDSIVLKLLKCTNAGLNSLGCQSVQSQSCIFKNGSCQLVTDFSTLLCSDKLNKVACLAVTNISEPCVWKSNSCQKYVIGSSKCADVQSLVSTSVCANISTESCFYDDQTNTCSQKCLNPAYTTQLLCEQSGYSCTWSSGCGLSGEKCGLAGQNLISCSVATSNCQFVDGTCKIITNLSALKCSDGLNQQACLALMNVSQTCQFVGSTCQILQVLPTHRTNDLTFVNANACSKITTEAAYFSSPSCQAATGGQPCDTIGFNKLACFSTTNTLNPCGWNSQIGICQVQQVLRTTQCTDLVSVNSLACQSVNYFDAKTSQYQLCSYNRWTYNCVIPTITGTSSCTDLGLNSAACQSISNLTLACRWLSNQCILVTSLGAAVNCSILSTVTPHTCELVTSNQICGYDSTRHSCTTSISPTTSCTTRGLNCYACASLNTSCYFDTSLQQCFTTTPSVLSSINCVSNFPSQNACVSITTTAQYCQWSSVNTACSLLKFPTNLNCTDFQNVNRLTCLAYMVNISGWVEAQNYCTYNTTLKGCVTFTSLVTGCGTGVDMNVHACVALSDQTQECYFDSTALTCGLVSSYTSVAQGGGGGGGGGGGSAYTALQCTYVNKLACYKITTSGQYCQWTKDAFQSKCAPATIGGQCTSYTNVNANVCATVNQSACQFDNVSACIAVTLLNIPCTQPGLSQIGCVTSTQQACQFDNSVNQCSQVTGQTSSKLNCSSPVNKLGCLAITGAACQWINNVCSAITVTATDLCSTYTSGLYNALVCSSITTAGQYCTYDSTHYTCASNQSPLDCQVGYNVNNCYTNNGCLFMSLICASQSGQNNACSSAKNYNDCVQAQNLSCQFTAGTCSQINVNGSNACSSYSNPTKYNAYTCTMIQTNACVYDNANYQCVTATLTNYACNTQGLSLLACLQNTTGNCMYSTNQGNYGCAQIQGPIQCTVQQGQVNINACLSVGSCIYQINSGCVDGQTSYTCSELSQTSKYYVSSAVCTSRTDAACTYNSTHQVCKVLTNSLPLCTTNSTINSVACLNNVVQTCDFVNNACTVLTDLKISCSQANSYRKCISSTKQPCQWTNGACQSYAVQGTCAQQQNINAMACMSVTTNEQCQFKDNGLAASACVLISDTLQSCFGLNKTACILTTINPCYFYNNQCIDISIPPYTAQCTNGYFFSQSACARIQTPGQPCAWNGSNCITVNVAATDSCAQYNLPRFGPQVCAQISTSICYWNSGCQSTGQTNCTYLSQSIGQNSLACVNAIGNCVFTNYTCLDASVQDTSFSLCSNPSNIGGCTRMNFGQTCQWNGTSCSAISVTYNCANYANVSPGVCAATSDVACMWSSINCAQTSTGSQPCSTLGFNSWACTTMTAGYCYFNATLNLCQTLTSIAQSCTNLNQNSCLANTTNCCFWNGNMCITANTNSTCSMTDYSLYCCTQPTSVSCSYTTSCATLSVFTGACSTAANLLACISLTANQCEWLNNACVSQMTENNACQSTFNALACINVPHSNANLCKFVGTCQTANLTSCSQLIYFSQPNQCSSVTDVGCYQGTNGCIVSSGSVGCQVQGINQIACLQNVNTCIWNNSQCSTFTIPTAGSQGGQGGAQLPKNCEDGIPNATYNIYISRKLCAYLGSMGSDVSCYLNSSYSCVQLMVTSTTTCNSVNTSYTGKECAQVTTEACMFDSTNYQCTNVISGSTCVNISLNQQACMLIANNCIWISSACALNVNFIYYSCSVINSKYTCLTNIYTSCQWQSSTATCVAYNGLAQTCTSLIAAQTSPGICWYNSSDYCGYNGTTCVVVSASTSCTNATSPLSCQAFGGCYWDNLIPSCQTLDISSAPKMTCSQLRYTTQAACVLPTAEGQTCYWNGSQCVAVNAYTAKCTDPLALQACRAIATIGQSCVFQNSACQKVVAITNLCTDIVNIYGCMSITTSGQYCQWLGQQCAPITPSDGYTSTQFVLVNQNVCNKVNTLAGVPSDTLPAVGAKYSATSYSCVKNDIIFDDCDTPGLNYYACLSLLNDTCSWNGVKCIAYIPEAITQCSDYDTVTPMVCQNIEESGLLCKWSSLTFGCTSMVSTDACTTIGLNQAACLAISTDNCIWKNQQCSQATILFGFTSCTSFSDPVNALTCASIDYNNQVCRYNNSGTCTTGFDPSFQDCDYPGLNLDGCVQVLRSKCIFLSGKCQFYIGTATDCAIQNVNAKVCQFVTNQACKFSRVKRGCTQVFTSERCSATGLNKIGCQLSCQWIDDLSYCTCQSISNYLSLSLNCNSLTDCSLNSKCTMNNGICRTKLCSDYPTSTCQGQSYWKYTCYVSNESSCQAASQCNELIGVSECTTFTLNGIQCVQDLYNSGHCLDYNCVSIKNQALCTGQCQWISNQCFTITCTQLSSITCQGIYNSQQCIWSGSTCYGVQTCQAMVQFYTNQQQQQCQASTVLNKQCYWQQMNPYSQTYTCSSSICASRGQSSSLCHGGETRNQVCILTQELSCLSCTEITDPCLCANNSGYCYYNNQGCFSNICSGLDSTACIAQSARCGVYSSTCKVLCVKLIKADCVARNTECHWTTSCQEGVNSGTVLNTLSTTITITTATYSAIIFIWYFINI